MVKKLNKIDKPQEVTYFKLNNQVNIPKNGKIQLDKD